MNRIIFSLILLITGVAFGYVLQKLLNAGVVKLPFSNKTLRLRLQQIALLGINPVAFLGAIWIAPLRSIRIAALPIIGILVLIVGGLYAWIFSHAFHMNDRRKGSFITCGSFTNIGSIGALIVFLLLGEGAFALVPFYKLFEQVVYYGIGFPVARVYAGADSEEKTFNFGKIVKDPYILTSVISIAIGFILNILGISRPDWYTPLNTLLIPLASVLLLISIGLAIHFGRMKPYLSTGAVILFIKFLLVPATAVGLGFAAGLGSIDDGLPLKVVLILSSMPVGFIALVPPTLYDLDLDLSNTAWFMTNAGLIIMVPLLWILINIF